MAALATETKSNVAFILALTWVMVPPEPGAFVPSPNRKLLLTLPLTLVNVVVEVLPSNPFASLVQTASGSVGPPSEASK